MSDRHPKWRRASHGDHIPAGQPYRHEYSGHSNCISAEYVAKEDVRVEMSSQHDPKWFVDSSWKPPLDLPTEPTWGIVVICDGPTWRERLGQWSLVGNGKRLREQRYFTEWRTEWVKAFIPLTDEQVARIEAAR